MGNGVSGEASGQFIQTMQMLNFCTQLQNLAKSEEGQQLTKLVGDMYNSECAALNIEQTDAFDQLGTMANGLQGGGEDDANKELKMANSELLQAAVMQLFLGQGDNTEDKDVKFQKFRDIMMRTLFPNFDKVAGSLEQRMHENEELKASLAVMQQKGLELLENFEKGSNEFIDNIASNPLTCLHYMAQLSQAFPDTPDTTTQ